MDLSVCEAVASETAPAVETAEPRRFRLTPERRAELDHRWFGPQESVPKPVPQRRLNRPGGALVTTTCGYCGEVMTLPASEYKQRLGISRSGKVYCSRACGASSRGASV